MFYIVAVLVLSCSLLCYKYVPFGRIWCVYFEDDKNARWVKQLLMFLYHMW